MSRRLAWGLFGLCQVFGLLGVWLQIRGDGGGEVVDQLGFLFMVAVVFPGVGAFIASRRPDHPIGWIYLGFGVLMIIAMFSIAYANYGLVKAPGALPAPGSAAWLGTWLWIPGLILLSTFSFLLFPDGRLPSRRWRPIAWISMAALAVAVLHGLLLLGEAPSDLLEGVESGAAAVAFLVTFGLAAVAMLGSAASLLVRLRHSAGEERQQLKWFLAASLVAKRHYVSPEVHRSGQAST